MSVTIDTGTTAPTTVLIEGNDANVRGATVFAFEQVSGTGTTTPTASNSILLGTTITTPNGFDQDRNGEDFASVVVLDGTSTGLTSYTLWATGAAGDIFFVDSNGNIIPFAAATICWPGLSSGLLTKPQPLPMKENFLH